MHWSYLMRISFQCKLCVIEGATSLQGVGECCSCRRFSRWFAMRIGFFLRCLCGSLCSVCQGDHGASTGMRMRIRYVWCMYVREVNKKSKNVTHTFVSGPTGLITTFVFVGINSLKSPLPSVMCGWGKCAVRGFVRVCKPMCLWRFWTVFSVRCACALWTCAL